MSVDSTAAVITGECVELTPGAPLAVGALSLRHEPVPAGQIAFGAPTTALLSMGDFAGLRLGVWEAGAGGIHDVEAEEIFLVTAGRATVEFHGGETGTAELSPGSLMRLQAGMRTTWTIHETLRKVYILAQPRFETRSINAPVH